MASTTILLVDDSQTSLMTGRLMLSREGYEVLTARSAEEGVERARRDQPDLVVMDADLPRVSGQEACRRLKGDASTADIPVVLMVGPLLTPPPVPGHGWSAVVAKPFAGPGLLAEVRRLTRPS